MLIKHLNNFIRFSWQVAAGTIPAAKDDREVKNIICHKENIPAEGYWSAVPKEGTEKTWMKLISYPIIDQLHRTHDVALKYHFSQLDEMVKINILKHTHYDVKRVTTIFVAVNRQVAEAYVERLVMTYGFTCGKLAHVIRLFDLFTILSAPHWTVEEELEDLTRHGVLVITDCTGEIAAMQRSDGAFVNFLLKRWEHGKATVILFYADDIMEKALLSGEDMTPEIYRNIQNYNGMGTKALRLYLSTENSLVYTYAVDKEGNYVCRALSAAQTTSII